MNLAENPMCEKAARIAKLEGIVAHCTDMRDALSSRGHTEESGDWQENEKRLANALFELARLHNETPALTQGEGSEPVGEPVAWRYRFKQGGWSGWHVETSEDEVKLNIALQQKSGWIEEYEVEPLYASPPLLPAGRADPRVREALEIRARRCATAIHTGWFLNKPEINFIELATSFIVQEFPSPQSQGLVEAAEWRPIETAPDAPWTRVIGWCVFSAGAEWREIQRSPSGEWHAYGCKQKVTHWRPRPEYAPPQPPKATR